MVHADLGKKGDPIAKITKAKRAEVLAQVVECLPSKHEALKSNPSTEKKKRKEKEIKKQRKLNYRKSLPQFTEDRVMYHLEVLLEYQQTFLFYE
jgi:hypothetical protein